MWKEPVCFLSPEYGDRHVAVLVYVPLSTKQHALLVHSLWVSFAR